MISWEGLPFIDNIDVKWEATNHLLSHALLLAFLAEGHPSAGKNQLPKAQVWLCAHPLRTFFHSSFILYRIKHKFLSEAVKTFHEMVQLTLQTIL